MSLWPTVKSAFRRRELSRKNALSYITPRNIVDFAGEGDNVRDNYWNIEVFGNLR